MHRAAPRPIPQALSDVTHSDTADLNHDGYITLDEVIAIRDAGITDDALILRLKKANQVFELTAHQQNVLRDDAVSQRVIDAMLGMSTEVAGAAAADRHGSIIQRQNAIEREAVEHILGSFK